MATSPGLDLSPLSHLIGFKTSMADARLRRAFHARMKALRLRPVDFTILLLLAANDNVSQKMLCEALDITAPGLAVILDRLQHRGLLLRERSEVDRRAHRLTLTPQGLRLADEARSLSLDLEDDVLAVLTPGERLLLGELLTRVILGARTGAGAPDEPRALRRASTG
ncbi:MarR family winged helix-turn-helix transcriptional regulator [Verticiella sediminum]|nr:MarR family winged helix-turn-helix transcriptional regulator [Verticiella sediminum]